MGRRGSDRCRRWGWTTPSTGSERPQRGRPASYSGWWAASPTYFRHLISISRLLLVVPGIIVVSLAALPVLWVDLLKDRILLRQRARRLQGQRRADWVVLAVARPWWFISQLWPVGLAVLAARLLNGVGM